MLTINNNQRKKRRMLFRESTHGKGSIVEIRETLKDDDRHLSYFVSDQR